MALYRKYRSQKFSDLIGQDQIRDILLEAIKLDKIAHAYLFSGPRGTGKTSTARLLAKAINCSTNLKLRKKGEKLLGEPCNSCLLCQEISEGHSIDVIEIDAASHTGVDEIREIIENSKFSPNKSDKKVYIIDEVHMLSKSAFNALLKTLEEPPGHVVFILATTEVHKLPSTILSRVQRYDFKRVSKSHIVENLRKITEGEGITADDKALELIALNAEGGHRDAIVLLEKISSLTKEINEEDVRNILGIADSKTIFQFLGAIFNNLPEEGLKIAHRIYGEGMDMIQFNKDAIEALRKILVFKGSGEILFDDSSENIEEIKKLSREKTCDELLKVIEILLKSAGLLKDISYPLLPIEMAIIEACSGSENFKVKALNSKQNTDSQTQNKGEQLKSVNNINCVESASPKEKKMEAPSVSNTESAPILQMTDDLWEKVVLEIKKENNSLAALLKDAKPLEYFSDKLVLGLKFEFHKKKISEPENCKLIEKIFGNVSGSRCILECQLISHQPQNHRPISDEELHKAAVEIFEIE